MLDGKLSRIRELLDLKEKTDKELAVLLGEAEKPARRGRGPGKKDAPSEDGASQGGTD